jgi:hypothetical protein
MTYFFNHGNKIVGVSMITGLITSSVIKSYPSGEIAFDMMRSTHNCYGVSRIRNNNTLEIDELSSLDTKVILYPNPVQNQLQIESSEPLQFILRTIEGRDLIQANINKGENNIDFSKIAQGIYVAWFIKDQDNFKIEKIKVIK